MPLGTLELPDPTSDSPPEQRARLKEVLLRAISAGAGRQWTDDEFNRMALAVFRYQAASSPIYGTFVRNRGLDPLEVDDWRAIPPVPTRAFKELNLAADEAAPVEATFLTSGTTRGGAKRGAHPVRDLGLYRASAMATAEHFLRIRTRIRVLFLAPPPEDRPESSLVHMFGLWSREWGDGRGGFFARADWSLRRDALEAALEEAALEDVPILLAGTAFAFVAWLDGAGPGRIAGLPDGSTVVETGGFKGRTRSVPRTRLYALISAALGVPERRIVNEYGMTEMLSQFYEPVLLDEGPGDPSRRRHLGPPWVRTRVLDPRTLSPLAEGETGILCHVDLANLDSVAAILTEDMGLEVEDGFRISGRTEGAEPRGCSLSMEALMESR